MLMVLLGLLLGAVLIWSVLVAASSKGMVIW